MKIQDAKFETRDNGTYLEILSPDLCGYTHLGDVCAAQFILGRPGAKELAGRIAAALNAFRGMTMQDIATVTAKLQGELTPAQWNRRKLSPEQVREVRAMAASGVNHAAIAPHFGLKRAAISRIVRFETYKEIR